jgi:hypothetical protein
MPALSALLQAYVREATCSEIMPAPASYGIGMIPKFEAASPPGADHDTFLNHHLTR